MAKFAVKLHGTNCVIKAQQRRWILPNRTVLRSVGFYSTRFVEAASTEEAAGKALEIVGNELEGLNQSPHPPVIVIEKVWEDEEVFAKYAPGQGFSWYAEGDSNS